MFTLSVRPIHSSIDAVSLNGDSPLTFGFAAQAPSHVALGGYPNATRCWATERVTG
jgi:hypothetical protein